jgi:hypothetical protein
MLGGDAARFCTMSRHGTPGLGSAPANPAAITAGQNNPAPAMTVMARQLRVFAILDPDPIDSMATAKSSGEHRGYSSADFRRIPKRCQPVIEPEIC